MCLLGFQCYLPLCSCQSLAYKSQEALATPAHSTCPAQVLQSLHAGLLTHPPQRRCAGWNLLEVVLSTHARGGLTENDFILAALDKEGMLRGKRQRFADI